MKTNESTHVMIVGAGLAGTLMACYLARAGYRVSIYERRPDPRVSGYAGGRSINLALSVRGITGLAGAGLAEMVMNTEAIPMRGRMIHPAAAGAAPVYQPYSHNSADAINSVSRGGLNLALLNAAAAYPNVELFFDCACLDIDLDAPAAVFSKGASTLRVTADLILGADGAFSPVRGRLQKTDRFEYSQSYLEHGYKELHIPATARGDFAMDPNALHIWPRGASMMIALPNRDKSFTCTLFWPLKGEHGLESLTTAGEVDAFFAKHYADAVPLMPSLAEDYLRNPNGSLVTVRCFPWHYQGKVCIFGDASHAIVPFYGQGMNAAFEDCLALSKCLAAHPSDRAAALAEFQSIRKPNADAIADMALANFVEMRDKVGSPAFLYRKKVEQTIHQAFPERVHPQYNLVSFSTVPYAEAQRRGRELDLVLDRLIADVPAARMKDLGDDAWRAEVRERAVVLLSSASAAFEKPMIDITPAITEALGVWPGDTKPTREVLCDMQQGANITLSTLRATVHLGAHADGPNHYSSTATGIGERALRPYVGPCHVIHALVGRNHRVSVADLGNAIDTIRHPRVLIRTGSFPDAVAWNQDFAGLSVELIEALAARGVITIGIDTPSVDLFASKDLEAHNAILKHDISILEGLVLDTVPPGEYELIAPPLKLIGFDASPVRAILRPLA
jgi:kynurenine 3-monooxygenase